MSLLWLENGERPPNIAAVRWTLLPAASRENILADHRRSWQDFLDEARAQYPAISERAAAEEYEYSLTLRLRGENWRYPEVNSLVQSFGVGAVGWREFNTNASAAQYLNLHLMLGAGYAVRHYNLCGQLAVTATMRIGLKEGLEAFSRTPRGPYVLKDAHEGTYWSDLARMYEQLGYHQTEGFSGEADKLSPESIREMLTAGKKIVVLLNMDTFSKGRLRQVQHAKRSVAHWITVLRTFNTPGGPVVRIYNSYDNREEIYLCEHLAACAGSIAGLTVRYRFFTAAP